MDDYPTDEQLNAIENYEVKDFDEFMEFIRPMWHWPELFLRSNYGVYTLVTGGWSGNEAIIASMNRNVMFWMMYWESSNRGGRHVFGPIRNIKE